MLSLLSRLLNRTQHRIKHHRNNKHNRLSVLSLLSRLLNLFMPAPPLVRVCLSVLSLLSRLLNRHNGVVGDDDTLIFQCSLC